MATHDKTTEPGKVGAETRRAEQQEAGASGKADRPPTPEEEEMAERVARDVPPETAENYEEMIERGANVRGEGQIEPEGAESP